jgi:hypothetical protein
LNALVAALSPLPEGHSDLLKGDVFDDPIPGLLKALMGQANARQLHLHTLEQAVVCQSQI